MANETATGNLSFRILPDELRKRFKGSLSYEGVDSTEKWVYAKKQVTHSSADILGTDDDYLMAPTTSVATGDKYKFLIIKHTGFTDSNENVSSPYGIMIDIDAGSTDKDSTDIIFLTPGDTIALKLPNCTVADLHARTCTISNGAPSVNGSSGQNAFIEIAAILDDVA